LTGSASGDFRGVETFDISGSGANHAVIDNAGLTAVAGTISADSGQSEIHIIGNAGDTYELQGNWKFVETSGGWIKYESLTDNKELWVSAVMRRVYEGDISGGATNDTFILDDVNGDNKLSGADYKGVDGKGGTNTLVLGDSLNGKNVDFSALLEGQLDNIHVIDLSGQGVNHLILGSTVMGANGASSPKTLTVRGDANTDTFELGAGWTYAGRDASGYYRYTNGSDVLLVQDTLGFVMSGTPGNDTFTLVDTSNPADGVVDSGDFSAIDGKGGSDVIKLGNGMETLDLSGLAVNQIKSVGTIDLTGNGKLLIMDDTSLTGMSIADGQHVTIKGDATDTFILNDLWTFLRVDGEYVVYQDTYGKEAYIQNTMHREFVGTGGNDIFYLEATSGTNTIAMGDFASITGNGGSDVIQIRGSGKTLDFSGISTGKITGVAEINLLASVNSTVVLEESSFANLGQSTVTVHGGTDDTFVLKGEWKYIGISGSYHEYEDHLGNTLLVATAMGNAITGTGGNDTIHVRTATDKVLAGEGDDTIVLHARDGNATNILTGADFASIDGEGGNDVLQVGDTNATLNLAGLGSGKISGVEAINLTGMGDNALLIDAGTLGNMGLSSLSISGDATDTLSLSGNWSFDGTHYVCGSDSIAVSGMQVNVTMTAGGTVTAGNGGDTITGFATGANTISG
ncbi:hypothetical protein LJC26_09130, partial [Desulfovibrio sp. OttesenSCG-928-O18]|nr:hypothetical protein [Desulfovibrio sp. OttesenSCG-928-O18]